VVVDPVTLVHGSQAHLGPPARETPPTISITLPLHTVSWVTATCRSSTS
jgi:hypothetical protein